jgi:hypothetical protein
VLRKFKFYQYLTIIKGTLHEDIWTIIISCSILFRIRNVSEKTLSKNQNTLRLPQITDRLKLHGLQKFRTYDDVYSMKYRPG